MGINFYKARNIHCSVRNFTRAGKFLTILFLFITGSFYAYSQTTSLSFTQIPVSNTDLIAPGRGVENWNGVTWNNGSGSGVMVPAGNKQSLNSYYRFLWGIEIETAQDVYNWTKFDAQINAAIDAGQMFSFGLMPMCTACSNVGISGLTYPSYLHTLMQAEATNSRDWQNSNGNWVPNWNSPNYLARYQALLNAVAAHIASGSHSGKNYKDVIYYVDIRGYGDFGEWHTWPWYGTEPAGRKVTSATLKALIDMNLAAFPNYPNVILAGAFDGGGASLTPTDVTYYALTKTNAWGQIGWRRDNWGDPGETNILDNNPGSYNPGSGSIAFAPIIMSKYKYALVVGEPDNSMANISKCGSQQCDLSNEINLYHATSFGNGNYPNTTDALLQANVIAASKLSGYRLILTGGSIPATLTSGGAFNLTLNWQNIGITPVYENWNVVYELRKSDGTVVWTGNSAFNLKLFLPQGTPTPSSDNFTLSTVAAGTYSMYMIVRDPANYKAPLPLAISGRNTDGSYLLKSNITVGTGPANQAPTANAGPDQNITLPTSSVTLNGSSSSDPNGSIAAFLWTKISGPSQFTISNSTAASTIANNLTAGVYSFQLKVTDNMGATALDTVIVTVNSASVNQPPVANAGADITITLPTNLTNLIGTASTDASGTITAYYWSQVSGPAAATFVSPANASTGVSGLQHGVYIFTLKVTNYNGATGLDSVMVTVNPALNVPPVANPGVSKSIKLPTNSISLDGSLSSDPDGTIVSYSWAEISGPSTDTITGGNSAIATAANLVVGLYTFELTVTDNNGASSKARIKITVIGLGTQPPVANAGADQRITLPTNTVTIDGSASGASSGSITSYVWTENSGPSTVGLTNTAQNILTNLLAGVYVFSLMVTDNNAATGKDSVTITVIPAAGIALGANAGPDQTIISPASSVNLNGSASSDPNGTITAYSWATVSGPGAITISNSNTATPSAVGLQIGEYVFELTVTDNNGATAKDQVTVTVLPKPILPNQAPVANAGNNVTITAPVNSLALNGTSSFDPDGTIVSYNWSQISGPSTAVISAGNTSTPTVSQLTVGQYVFQLSVTDNNGASNTNGVTVTVNQSVQKLNLPPVADAGPSDTISLPNNSFTLNASQSTDPDGTIVSYQWQQIGGPNTVTSSSMNSSQVSISNLQAGVYQFQVTVTDNLGETSAATMNLTVEYGSSSNDQINVFPNPAHSMIHDKITSDVMGTVKIYVYDMNGRLVLQEQVAKSSEVIYETMNVSRLAPGLYTVQINIANRTTMVTKFIKD